jgi:glutamate N-acetyltransferase/amino-acid N-acetyltransferase
MPKLSPLAPAEFPALSPIAGIALGGENCGIRYKHKKDLFLAELVPGSTVAGVFTRSKTASAPVEWCRKALRGGKVRAIVVNSGNSNAFTGSGGVASVKRTADKAAAVVGCRPNEVFIASTGVIGEPLPDEKITEALAGLHGKLDAAAWRDGADAIMTTDTFAKGATATARIGGTTVTINGIAKGSGMIAPDMATMLCFIFTDAKLPAGVLQAMLSPGVEKSFNAITVDSDTSTSDTVLLFATGAGAEHPEITSADDPAVREFSQALDAVLLDLAHQVVRDGEGATKFISVTITGAEDDGAAKRIGLAVANSPLVKTAIAGEDANWGRIVMAVGKAGEAADRDKISIVIGGVPVAETGMAVDGFDEAPVAEHMKGQEIDIQVDVGVGSGRATVWTCDLTHGYIEINADYRS